jgi:hypothetical protein
MRILVPILAGIFVSGMCFGQVYGEWKMSGERSVFSGEAPRSMSVQITPHPKGEVFTLETVTKDGRTISSSAVLYLDGSPRSVRDFECSGTQSSRRLDSQTIEILRTCAEGPSARWVRRISPNANELVLEIREEPGDSAGRSRTIRRIVMVRQKEN